ncbi:hypothetical protein [Qipengyuania sp.]|uniref:hypothetical protein n=1 Tax=Qipengyuania sp. TaxID=2004515 RepID=UPI0035C85579
MDRRKALGLFALVPAIAGTAGKASACSIAVESAATYAERLPRLAKLFEAWFARDELRFLGTFHGPRGSEDLPSEDMLRQYIAAADDPEPRRLFDTMFTRPDDYRSLQTLSAVGEYAFAAVSEQAPGGIGPDCSNMPILHLFLIEYRMGRPATLRLIESATWSGYGQVANWSM